MKKITKAPKEKKTALAPYAKTTLWVARDAYNDVCGTLVTEPGNPDLPIAFLFGHQQEKVLEVHQYADDVAENPDLLDRAIDYAIEYPISRMDLRDRGRADSQRPMPGWCYGLQITPQDEDGMFGGNDEFPWNPYCPVRLAQMLAKKPA